MYNLMTATTAPPTLLRSICGGSQHAVSPCGNSIDLHHSLGKEEHIASHTQYIKNV